jgi:methyl-accepting chemotaxis protein
MNQVTTIVRDTATGAGKVQAAIAEAHREATEGGETVRRAIGAMTEIEQGAREITQIINVIDGIAFQTNLLALNAGVEAARAGDAGKGFAVVANEVRALAQRSADAARDIKALITGSTEQVEGGVRLVNETGELLGKIVGSIGEINASVTAIAQATEAQSVNLQQVNAAIGEMDRMTQQNAAMVEQSTAAARSLAEEAQDLAKQVGQFRTGQAEGGQPASVFAFNKSKRPGAQPLQARGNLALRAEPALAEDDWSEF